MKIIEFSVKLKTTIEVSELIRIINWSIESRFPEVPYEQAGDYIEWKCMTFGLELTLTYFSDTDLYYLEGCRSEKIASLIPDESEFQPTDISSEMLDIFKVILPEGNWYL